MNILLVDQFAELGGGQQCLLDIAPAIRAAGWSLTAALPAEGPYAARLRDLGADVRFFSIGAYSNGAKSFAERVRFAAETPGVARALRSFIEDVRPDLVYVNGPRVLPAAALAARSRTPLLFHSHSHVPQSSAARAAAQALRWSRASVVSCCLHAVEPLLHAIPAGRLRIVHYGVPAPVHEKPERDARFTFGLVGRISPEKGQDHFVRAAAELHRDHPDVRFVLCGDVLFGDRAALAYRNSLDALAAGASIERLGWRDDPRPVIAGLDVMVVPSVREPATPRVILEAYARGVPVLAYATGGIAEILEDGVNGILLPEPDHTALARTMCELAEGPRELLRHLGENGRRRWRERHTVERYSREMLQTLTEAAEAPVRV